MGAHCILIVQERHCQKVRDKRKNGQESAARTDRESERRREEKRQSCWCCRYQRKACRMAQALTEKLEHTGLVEQERVASAPQSEHLARTPEPPSPKKKEQGHLSKSQNRDEGNTQGGKDPHLGDKEKSQSERTK